MGSLEPKMSATSYFESIGCTLGVGLGQARAAARAAALREHALAIAVLLRDQLLGRRDEVRERVLLLILAAVLVPRAPELLAAANVRDRVDPAAVEQARRGLSERRW